MVQINPKHDFAARHQAVNITGLRRLLTPILKATLAGVVRWPPPTPSIYGRPGIGKTSLVKAIAAACGFGSVLILHIDQLEQGDINVPVPIDDGALRFHAPEVLLALTQPWSELQRVRWDRLVASGKASGSYVSPGPVLLLLDEFANASPSVQTIFHALILDREFGATRTPLRPDVQIVLTCNDRSHGAHVHEMSPMLKSRVFPHLKLEPEAREVVEWGRLQEWPTDVIAFLAHNEACLDDFTPNSPDLTFACPRSWDEFVTLLTIYEWDGSISPDDPLFLAPAQGTIGPSVAGQYLAWRATARKAPSAEEIITAPLTVNACLGRVDAGYVAVENLLRALRHHPESVDAALQWGLRADPQIREWLLHNLLNQEGATPVEVTRATLRSVHLSKAMQGSAAQIRAVNETAQQHRGQVS